MEKFQEVLEIITKKRTVSRGLLENFISYRAI